MAKARRVALYLRVSTDDQTVENQRRELEAAAAARGWVVTAVYADAGVSGAKGRDGRPQLDLMLKDAVRRRFEVVMTWAVDRLGRSLPDLIASMQELHAAKVDLFMLQTGVDTTTPAGKAMFQMMGVFAEFERNMIQSRVNAGLLRARAAGTKLGRPQVSAAIERAIRERLSSGMGILKVAAELRVGSGTVQRVRKAMLEQAAA